MNGDFSICTFKEGDVVRGPDFTGIICGIKIDDSIVYTQNYIVKIEERLSYKLKNYPFSCIIVCSEVLSKIK